MYFRVKNKDTGLYYTRDGWWDNACSHAAFWNDEGHLINSLHILYFLNQLPKNCVICPVEFVDTVELESFSIKSGDTVKVALENLPYMAKTHQKKFSKLSTDLFYVVNYVNQFVLELENIKGTFHILGFKKI